MRNKEAHSLIIPLYKRAGETSFASLSVIKRALATREAGHTGTLDKFATGLLVVCTGRLTKLSSLITASDKAYEAVIVFGKETDTLDVTGRIVKESELPEEADFFAALEKLRGKYMQTPPVYSRVSVDGVRASEAARRGESVELAAREVTVKKSAVRDILISAGRVAAVYLSLEVSKGTYVRSYARDLAALCESTAYVAALARTRIGNFRVEDSLFYPDSFCISIGSSPRIDDIDHYVGDYLHDEAKRDVEKEKILSFSREMDEGLAADLGMEVLHVKKEAESSFYHGAKLKREFFEAFDDRRLCEVKTAAVFSYSHVFMGVVKAEQAKLSYAFVIPLPLQNE